MYPQNFIAATSKLSLHIWSFWLNKPLLTKRVSTEISIRYFRYFCSILSDQSRSLKFLEKSSLASCGQRLVQTDRILKYKWWKLRACLVFRFPRDTGGTSSTWSQTCVPSSRCLPADELLQLGQPVTLQRFPDRVEKSKVVFKVV